MSLWRARAEKPSRCVCDLSLSCLAAVADSLDLHRIHQVVNPSTGEKIGEVSEASPKDVDRAVAAAQKAFDTVWGLHATGTQRGRLLMKLADAIEANLEEIAAVEVCCALLVVPHAFLPCPTCSPRVTFTFTFAFTDKSTHVLGSVIPKTASHLIGYRTDKGSGLTYSP